MLKTLYVSGTNRIESKKYRLQIDISWLVRTADDEVRPTVLEMLAEMGRRAQEFNSLLRDAVNAIPEKSEVLEIVL